MANKQIIRWCSVSDTHGNLLDSNAYAAFRAFIKHYKPTLRIHHGDLFNFSSLRAGASDSELDEELSPDIEAGIDFAQWYKPSVILRGNHDERLWDFAARSKNGALRSLCTQQIASIEDRIGPSVTWLPYHKRHGVYKLGHLKIIHGYHSGITAARQAALVYGAVVMGHIHAVDQYAIPGLERRVGRASGCLCQLDQDYNARQPGTLRQSHGWVYGLLYPNGDYIVWQAEDVNGRWVFPSEMVTHEGANHAA